jgi:magnesium chelatase family protein
MVGLPDASVRESRDRVRSAIRNSGYDFPEHRVTVNLAPADVRKAGASYDLPIALVILAATGVIERRHVDDIVLLGELSLDGSIQPIRGVLPIAVAARREGKSAMLLPRTNAPEAAVVGVLRILPVDSLGEAVHVLNTPVLDVMPAEQPSPAPGVATGDAGEPPPDFADVRGQRLAKRALEVAAAGGHNVLLIGPPGGGKTMMARRLPGILPPLDFDEALDCTSIHSVAGLIKPGCALISCRPFRAPHHTASAVAIATGAGFGIQSAAYFDAHEIALALGRAGVNIEDMALYPAADMRTGAVTLWVASAEEAERAATVVGELGHTVSVAGGL